MAKYTLTIEGETLGQLIENVKKELMIITDKEKEALEFDRMMSTKIQSTKKANKRWEDYEDTFIIDNYRFKSVKWIAASLQRSHASVQMRLQYLYKNIGIPKLKKRNGKIKITSLT